VGWREDLFTIQNTVRNVIRVGAGERITACLADVQRVRGHWNAQQVPYLLTRRGQDEGQHQMLRQGPGLRVEWVMSSHVYIFACSSSAEGSDTTECRFHSR